MFHLSPRQLDRLQPLIHQPAVRVLDDLVAALFVHALQSRCGLFGRVSVRSTQHRLTRHLMFHLSPRQLDRLQPRLVRRSVQQTVIAVGHQLLHHRRVHAGMRLEVVGHDRPHELHRRPAAVPPRVRRQLLLREHATAVGIGDAAHTGDVAEELAQRGLLHVARRVPVLTARVVVRRVVEDEDHLLLLLLLCRSGSGCALCLFCFLMCVVALLEGRQKAVPQPRHKLIAVERLMVILRVAALRRQLRGHDGCAGVHLAQVVGRLRLRVLQHSVARHGVHDDEPLPLLRSAHAVLHHRAVARHLRMEPRVRAAVARVDVALVHHTSTNSPLASSWSIDE